MMQILMYRKFFVSVWVKEYRGLLCVLAFIYMFDPCFFFYFEGLVIGIRGSLCA
jgi:hypothetical protein